MHSMMILPENTLDDELHEVHSMRNWEDALNLKQWELVSMIKLENRPHKFNQKQLETRSNDKLRKIDLVIKLEKTQ